MYVTKSHNTLDLGRNSLQLLYPRNPLLFIRARVLVIMRLPGRYLHYSEVEIGADTIRQLDNYSRW